MGRFSDARQKTEYRRLCETVGSAPAASQVKSLSTHSPVNPRDVVGPRSLNRSSRHSDYIRTKLRFCSQRERT